MSCADTEDTDLESVLDELAAQTANRNDIVVAKLDFRANDVPGANVRFAPNCLLFPKGGGEVGLSHLQSHHACLLFSRV